MLSYIFLGVSIVILIVAAYLMQAAIQEMEQIKTAIQDMLYDLRRILGK